MKGSENTPAANYMQTIFRVQTHAVLEGRQKSDCYVFDFAPDRALTAVAETAKMAVYAQTEKGKKQMKPHTCYPKTNFGLSSATQATTRGCQPTAYWRKAQASERK